MPRIVTRRKTTTMANGTKVVTTKLVEAAHHEWELQHAQCRELAKIPNILFVGGMEAGKRGPRAQVIAKATGLTAGHPDLTILLPGARCAFIENKVGKGKLSPAQIERHAALRSLGHIVEVVRATTPSEAADRAVALVMGWLAANDNISISNEIYGT